LKSRRFSAWLNRSIRVSSGRSKCSLACTGRVVLSGVGKSGAIARKLAGTFSSTGTPAIFVHPTEAAHGDLGTITEQDVAILLSFRGESDELAYCFALR
jgi:arabinose-5-phosphate isomerase